MRIASAPKITLRHSVATPPGVWMATRNTRRAASIAPWRVPAQPETLRLPPLRPSRTARPPAGVARPGRTAVVQTGACPASDRRTGEWVCVRSPSLRTRGRSRLSWLCPNWQSRRKRTTTTTTTATRWRFYVARCRRTRTRGTTAARPGPTPDHSPTTRTPVPRPDRRRQPTWNPAHRDSTQPGRVSIKLYSPTRISTALMPFVGRLGSGVC